MPAEGSEAWIRETAVPHSDTVEEMEKRPPTIGRRGYRAFHSDSNFRGTINPQMVCTVVGWSADATGSASKLQSPELNQRDFVVVGYLSQRRPSWAAVFCSGSWECQFQSSS